MFRTRERVEKERFETNQEVCLGLAQRQPLAASGVYGQSTIEAVPPMLVYSLVDEWRRKTQKSEM